VGEGRPAGPKVRKREKFYQARSALDCILEIIILKKIFSQINFN
jgi:hypothetical protein